MRKRKHHSIAFLKERLATVVATIWDRRVPAGKRLWTIPADPDNDFDLVFMDAIQELEWRRKEMWDDSQQANDSSTS